MFNLFKKSTTQSVSKTTNEIIEEIHETFYTEADRLLASASVENSLDTNKEELIKKCRRLKALGFSNTQEIQEAEKEITRLENLKRENKVKQTLIETINYFSFKYPNYKFITEESVKKICAKYNLVYSTIDKYIGTVPDKNLKHIEDFKVAEEDECYISEEWTDYLAFGRGSTTVKYETFTQYKLEQELTKKNPHAWLHERHAMSYTYRTNKKCLLEIAAPLKDFNMEGMEVKNFKISKIEIPDPVVLKPVIFNGQKHYLIVTAWGIEASDEIVVNQKMN